MRKRSLFFILMLSALQLIQAQTEDHKVAVGIFAGRNEYDGDLGSSIFRFDKTTRLFGALTLQTYVSPSFDLGVQGTYGSYAYEKGGADLFKGQKYDGFMFLHYKLNNGYILPKTAKLSPFLAVGIGLTGYAGDNGKIKTFPMDLSVPLGAGLKYQISSKVAIQYKYLYFLTNHDSHDMKVGNLNDRADNVNKNDKFGEHTLGIIFSLGGKRDKDKDGVEDKYDKCPDTPAGVKVDAKGCPVDSDGDGVPDYLDQCANTPAGVQVDAQGCPLDADKDGVADYMDKCPNTPAGVKVDAKGCPIDTDKDGVPDYIDKCPNTPAGVKVDAAGCPIDTDKDGVPDYMDKCPTVAGLAKYDGCPDTDGDGIPDNIDKCPTVPGIAANKGCPEVKAETKKVFAQALQGIQFETGKDVIKKASFPILDKVVSVMKNNPEYLLDINGHTDNVGDDAKNQVLSQKRADAVKKYLTDKGIDASKLTAKGYGETQPVADNKTAAGRAKNRRVEFKVNF